MNKQQTGSFCQKWHAVSVPGSQVACASRAIPAALPCCIYCKGSTDKRYTDHVATARNVRHGQQNASKVTMRLVVSDWTCCCLLSVQSGRREVGETAVVGYFQQHPPEVNPSLRMIEYIREVAEKRKSRAGESGLVGPPDTPEVLLEKLGFPRKIQYQKVESLSGGERRRLHLAAVLASAPNILILDEPTNDLDLNTVEVLEEMLSVYLGLLFVVSHDRAFMEGSTDSLLVMPGDGTVERFMGKYSDYLKQLQHLRQRQAAAAAEQQKKSK